jgi:WD40 repeat protein
MILIHFPVWVTLYFIEPQEFASKHDMRKIACFDVNDDKVVALAGPSLNDAKLSRIIVKSLSSDAYHFSTTFAASVEDITLSPKGDKVAVCSNSVARVWDVVSNKLLFEKAKPGVIEVEFKGEGCLLMRTIEGEETVQFGSPVRDNG